jgi:hypothetical protein
LTEVEKKRSRNFLFVRNGEAEPAIVDWVKGIDAARQAISEAMNAKNIAFLLGAGCSSLMRDQVEVGISTMAPLAKEFYGETLAAQAADSYFSEDANTGSDAPARWRLTAEELRCLDMLGIDLEEGYNRNLERFMEVLFAHRFVLQRSRNAAHGPSLELIKAIIEKVQNFLWSRVNEGAFVRGDDSVRKLYERFYK